MLVPGRIIRIRTETPEVFRQIKSILEKQVKYYVTTIIKIRSTSGFWVKPKTICNNSKTSLYYRNYQWKSVGLSIFINHVTASSSRIAARRMTIRHRIAKHRWNRDFFILRKSELQKVDSTLMSDASMHMRQFAARKAIKCGRKRSKAICGVRHVLFNGALVVETT